MGLLAHYTLESSLGGLTYQNNGGKLTPTAGKVGNGYRRIGVNDGSDFLQSTNVITLANSFTMACWAFVTGAGGSANGLVTHHSHADFTGSGINVKRISDDDYRISCNSGTGTDRTFNSYYGTTNIKNKWAHLVVRYHAPTQELSLWVNGVREFTITYPMVTQPDHICIHSWSTTYNSSPNYRPAAIVDEVKIYDHALIPLEIYGLGQSLSDLHPLAKDIRDIYLQEKVLRISQGSDVLYRAMSEIRQVRLSDPTTLFADPTTWVEDGSRGLYRDVYNLPAMEVLPNGFVVSNVRRVSAKFTSYHDDPTGGVGMSYVYVVLDDDTTVMIGIRDGWTDGSRGQTIHRPLDQGGDIENTTDPVVKFPIHYDVPFNRTVVRILIESRGYRDDTINVEYPFTLRGISDLVVTELIP